MNTLNGIGGKRGRRETARRAPSFTAKPKALARLAPEIRTASPIGLEAQPSPTARR